MTADLRHFITALADGEVAFIIIGAVALTLQGSARVTQDLDICYARDPDNLIRLARALAPLRPSLRGVPVDMPLPFTLNAPTLRAGLNFTLTTARGDIDLLGEVTGLGGYRAVDRFAESMVVYERSVRVLNLDGLERAKRAAGRPKDLTDLADILEIRKQRSAGR